jgi:hypothetical protein
LAVISAFARSYRNLKKGVSRRLILRANDSNKKFLQKTILRVLA